MVGENGGLDGLSEGTEDKVPTRETKIIILVESYARTSTSVPYSSLSCVIQNGTPCQCTFEELIVYSMVT